MPARTVRRQPRRFLRYHPRRISDRAVQPEGPWCHAEAVEFATLHWVDWSNNRRLLEPIGHVPPAEYEALYYETTRVA
jgi:transposase InsO family protein